jgi:DnaJ-domain-containing protein 1
MTSNPFAAFGLEPAPALDGAALKERFARATAESHPDRFQQAPEMERSAPAVAGVV